jgi:hypothetical protein
MLYSQEEQTYCKSLPFSATHLDRFLGVYEGAKRANTIVGMMREKIPRILRLKIGLELQWELLYKVVCASKSCCLFNLLLWMQRTRTTQEYILVYLQSFKCK